jgi:parallel beta-helix repeat protein
MKKRDYSAVSDRGELIVVASLITVLAISTLSTYLLWVPPIIEDEEPTPTPLQLPRHGAIAIDGDTNFSATALLEGWLGDGSPENPYIIDGSYIGPWISGIDIRNTRVNFIICNCNGFGAPEWTHGIGGGAGIYLNNVTNGELVNNTCKKNEAGIYLADSLSNTVVNNICNCNCIGIVLKNSHLNNVVNNTCNDNWFTGIYLNESGSNTVANNTCRDNARGISLDWSSCNNVANNTCKYNVRGVYLSYSESNIVMYNTCNKNMIGIFLNASGSNIGTDNICTNNRVGIYLQGTGSNTVVNNIISGNTVHDIVDESELEKLAHREYVAKQSVWFLAGCGMILVVSVIAFVQFRRMGI